MQTCSPSLVFIALALSVQRGQAYPGTFNENEFTVQPPLRLAEGTVILDRVHPVISNNFPGFDDDDAEKAAALIQTHDSRVPHYHVSRLREAHEAFRAPGSLTETKQVGEQQDGRWLDEMGIAFNESQNLFLSKGRGAMISTSDKAKSAAQIRMTNLRDSQYVGPLKVGSQGDILSVVYDTGSTNLWFASTLCKEGPCLKRRRYDPSSSNTFVEGSYDLHVTFGTGELTGQQGTDDVEMDGFKVRQQTFSMIQKEEGSIFDQLDFEGILGLAFPAMSANGATPFFDQVMSQKLLKTNAVSFYFTKLPTDASAVLFGEVDPRLYDGEQVGLPVTEEYYWMVDLKDFKIGNKLIDGPNKVVFDTGTTYYTAPKGLMPTVLAEMPQTDCASIRKGTSRLPDMTFTLLGHEGREVTVTISPPEYFVSSGYDGKCDPAWMAIEVPSPHGPALIFGEAFMRSFFTSFHRGDGSNPSEMRIAPQNHKAIDLVRQLKKVEGMSVNQKKQMSLIQAHGNLKGTSVEREKK